MRTKSVSYLYNSITCLNINSIFEACRTLYAITASFICVFSFTPLCSIMENFKLRKICKKKNKCGHKEMPQQVGKKKSFS